MTKWAYLGEIRRDDSPVGEFAPCEGLQRRARRIGVVIFHEYFTHSVGLPAPAAGAGHFHLEHMAVFFTLLFDVLADFWGKVLVSDPAWGLPPWMNKKGNRANLHIPGCQSTPRL